MCRIINKCNNNLCINQTENKKELIEQVKDRECGVICDTLYALQYDKDFRNFLSELEHRKKKIKGGKTLLICRCDKSDPNICRNAGVNQVPCCDCPLNNWPDLCMAIMGSKGCVIVAISCKCRLTSRKYKEPVKVQYSGYETADDLVRWLADRCSVEYDDGLAVVKPKIT
jgi:hypothetical protein